MAEPALRERQLFPISAPRDLDHQRTALAGCPLPRPFSCVWEQFPQPGTCFNAAREAPAPQVRAVDAGPWVCLLAAQGPSAIRNSMMLVLSSADPFSGEDCNASLALHSACPAR